MRLPSDVLSRGQSKARHSAHWQAAGPDASAAGDVGSMLLSNRGAEGQRRPPIISKVGNAYKYQICKVWTSAYIAYYRSIFVHIFAYFSPIFLHIESIFLHIYAYILHIYSYFYVYCLHISTYCAYFYCILMLILCKCVHIYAY